MGIFARILFILMLFVMFKAGKAINKFDICENIGHSHKQTRKPKN